MSDWHFFAPLRSQLKKQKLDKKREKKEREKLSLALRSQLSEDVVETTKILKGIDLNPLPQEHRPSEGEQQENIQLLSNLWEKQGLIRQTIVQMWHRGCMMKIARQMSRWMVGLETCIVV